MLAWEKCWLGRSFETVSKEGKAVLRLRKNSTVWMTPYCWLSVGLPCLFGTWLFLFCALLGGQTFTNVTSSVFPGSGPGNVKVAWGDYNSDGFVDLHTDGVVWRNYGGGNFYSVASGVNAPVGSGTWGDYNNDGWLDLFSFNGRRLFRNDWGSVEGTGFTEISLPQNEFPPSQNARSASWGDHDNDGDLDLYQGGYESQSSGYYPDTIIKNNGDDNFTVTWTQPNDTVVSPGRPRPARGVTSADFDRDGDIDVYVSNYRLETNGLYVNDGSGNFTDQAPTRGATGGTGHTIGSAWGDMNNDGYLDLFVGNFSHPWGSQPGSQFLANTGPGGGYSFQNQLEWAYGNGEWQESYASPTLGDYDNDGDLDLFFTTVYEVGSYGIPNFPRLYRNDGNWNFTNQTNSAGLSGLGPTYQAAFADYDNDGDLDLLTHGKLFRNNGNSNHWLKLKMVGDGQTITRDAVGAQVRIQVGEETLTRQVEFGTGEGNQNDPTLHFGLGSHAGTVDLTIAWPGGGTQLVSDLAVDQLHTIDFDPGDIVTQWVGDSSSSWHAAENWVPRTVPNSSFVSALLPGSSTSVTNISLVQQATVESLQIASSNTYHVRGPGSLQMDSTDGMASIEVTSGDHRVDTDLEVVDDTMIHIATGASLSLGGNTNLGGRTITKDGAGTLYLDGTTQLAGSTLNIVAGAIGGEGEIIGDFQINSGAIAPGREDPGASVCDFSRSCNQMKVLGDFELGADGTMAVEIGGALTSRYDHLSVQGTAELNGSIEITLTDGYQPEAGRQFMVLAADEVVHNNVSLTGPAASFFTLHFNQKSAILEAVVPVYQWSLTTGGDWHTDGNWSRPGFPNGLLTVELTGAIAQVVNIEVNAPVTFARMQIDGPNSYRLTGSGELQLRGGTGGVVIDVLAGDHQWQIPATATSDTTFNIAANSQLTLADSFDFDGVTITKQGSGTLQFDATATGSGQLDVVEGTIGGDGVIGGSLQVTAGAVAPGTGTGDLEVRGTFTLEATGTLEIEIASNLSTNYDRLNVIGEAILDGTLSVELLEGYQPVAGTNFLVFTASQLTNNGLTLAGPDADSFNLLVTGTNLILRAVSPGDTSTVPEPASAILLLVTAFAASGSSRQVTGGLRRRL